jgi:hypothetical protein
VSKLKSECNVSSLCQAIVRTYHKVIINYVEPSLCDKLLPISKGIKKSLKEYWRLFKRKKSKLNERALKIISVQ